MKTTACFDTKPLVSVVESNFVEIWRCGQLLDKGVSLDFGPLSRALTNLVHDDVKTDIVGPSATTQPSSRTASRENGGSLKFA
jgi:hypothetical protein